MGSTAGRTKLELIIRVKKGEKVARVCREIGISRKTFYEWCQKYQKARPQHRLLVLADRRFKKRFSFKTLDPKDRLLIINKIKERETSVAALCRQFGISRKTFYKWKRRFETKGEIIQALADARPKAEAHWRFLLPDKQQLVLDLVAAHPEYSCHRLAKEIPQIGHHGIQNLLNRLGLAYYHQRLVYSQTQAPASVVRPATAWRDKLQTVFSTFTSGLAPPPSRLGWLQVFLLSFGSSLILSLLFFVSVKIFQEAPSENKLGLIFAALSLACGSFFFLYSLKYYLTLAIVLGFSRHVGVEERGGEETFRESLTSPSLVHGLEQGPIGWLKKRLVGLEENGQASGSGYRGGLQPDLSRVTLTRKPFVSIHLAMYNEKKVVNRLLTACTSMDYENYEVIVVDDSNDETMQILKDWQNHPRVKILHRENREGFKGGALKLALVKTDPRTEFVLVFDADFIPYPDTITQFLKYFQSVCGTLDFQSVRESDSPAFWPSEFSGSPSSLMSPNNIAAIQGYQWHVLNKSENWITRGVRSEYAGSYVVERSGAEVYGGLKQIAGSVYMIRKDVLDRFGWQTSITEDFQLTLRLYEAGYKIVYTPYLQAPSECVSTIKRLIRQRMRWAEGHSFNVKKMFWRLLVGRWVEVGKATINYNQSKRWVPSQLTFMEKLEFLYLSPYYLQALFFMLGTFGWFLSEAVFKARLPFWIALWGWSLVLTNLFALPLLNSVGLFLEEADERDYLGILSFVALSYFLIPFQAYASLKGFLEKEEGPWFRTPKTGMITDVLVRGRFYRWLTGIVPGWGQPAVNQLEMNSIINPALHPYLALTTANNRFNGFSLNSKRRRFLSKTILVFLLIVASTLLSLTRGVPTAFATNPSGIFNLHTNLSTVLTTTVSHQLQDAAADVACNTGQSAKHGKNIAWRQWKPDVTGNTTDAGTPCPVSATGTGWIFDTQFGSDGYITNGAWNFYLYTSDNAANNVGNIRACVYRVQVSGTALGTSTLLFQVTGSTDVWVGGALSSTITTGVSPCGGNCTFTVTETSLYVDFYVNSNNGANSATAAISFGEEQCEASPYVRIVTPTVQIPENLVFFLAAAPFIPMMVVWFRQRRGHEVKKLPSRVSRN